jgi:septum formation protein
VRLVLASASPRRQELLREAGINFVVHPANVNEKVRAGESPKDCAQRLAKEKALAVAPSQPDDWVLGADTVVAVQGEILGKPADGEDAARMLRMLSGREHVVVTGVCLVGPAAPMHPRPEDKEQGDAARRAIVDVRSESTRVTFAEISELDIQVYVASGEPMDKAGAYAIQGLASRWIPRIEGDYSNVVGLPIRLVKEMLCEHGVYRGA